MYPNREVFTQAPLALVAAEVRFTDLARFRQQETRDQITLALEDRFPFAQPFEQPTWNVTLGGPQAVQQSSSTVSGVALKNAAGTESVTFTSSFLTYETTAYIDFETLLDAVLQACDALLRTNAKPALQRIGLRYIDEIRVPDLVDNVSDWRPWINRRFIDPVDVGPSSISPTTSQGITTYDLGNQRGLNVRFAALNGVSIVGAQNLVRHQPDPGPFFVLDFDGFEDYAAGAVTALDLDVVKASLSAVHAPAGATFQRAITDKARELFRGQTV